MLVTAVMQIRRFAYNESERYCAGSTPMQTRHIPLNKPLDSRRLLHTIEFSSTLYVPFLDPTQCFVEQDPVMEKSTGIKSCSKTHLERLATEITKLIEHAQPPKSDLQATCWSSNSQDMDIALSVLRAAGSSIHDGVTRFNLVFKANPGEAASESMVKEIEGFCQQMVSSLILLSSVGASKAMLKYCATSVRAVLHSVKDLIEALLDTARHSQVNSITGTVWQACKELQQTPKTNKLACRREMMQWSVAIKDTIEEFEQAANTSNCKSNAIEPDAEGTADLEERFDGLGKGEADEFDDFDGADEDYSPSELRCVEASLNVLRVFRRCLKVTNDALNTLDSSETRKGGGDNEEVTDEEQWVKERLGWAHSLQSFLEEANEGAGELGVLLYPPLDASDLSARTNDLEQSLVKFCDTFGFPEEIGGEAKSGKGPEPLRTAVGNKLGTLREELERLGT